MLMKKKGKQAAKSLKVLTNLVYPHKSNGIGNNPIKCLTL